MPENSTYEALSKDDFLKSFDFANNPTFVLRFIADNNPQAVMNNLQQAGLVSASQTADPDLIYNILLSFLQSKRIPQLRAIVRVPLNQTEPATMTPAILEGLSDLQSSTQLAL